MRKKAQERKMRMSASSSSSSLTYQSCLLDATSNTGMVSSDVRNGSSYMLSTVESTQSAMDGYPMEQIWKEIEAPALLGIDEQKESIWYYPLLSPEYCHVGLQMP
jgi:transcription factor MYB, plant